MAERVEVSRNVEVALAGAYGAAVGGYGGTSVVGTEHLLLGVTGLPKPAPVAQALAEAQLTWLVVMAALRKRAGRSDGWHSSDDAGEEPAPGDRWWERYPARKRMEYTGAAQVALHRAAAIVVDLGGAQVDNDHLLLGLLAADDNRAAEVLRGCGVEPSRLRDRLLGVGQLSDVGGQVDPELRPTRDALLGTASYPTRSRADRLRASLPWLFTFNLAELPVAWVCLDARDQARRLGTDRPGTEHLVLAILAIHETLRQYPHMRADDDDHRYAGGRVLTQAGVTYRIAREAVGRHPERLGSDARPASAYTRRSWMYRNAAAGTGELLLAVLTQNDSRAANLLRLVGVPPARVRAELRTR